MITPEKLRRTIESYTHKLVELGIVIVPSVIVFKEGRVTWGNSDRETPLIDFQRSVSVDTYRRWATTGEYTMMLFDGALLQLSYEIEKRIITSHRLVYVPCPYDVDREILERESISDILDQFEGGSHGSMLMKTAIRFDYAPGDAALGHPAAHLTINIDTCRIPVLAPMHPAQFLRFVIENFYSESWKKNHSFFDTLTQKFASATVTSAEQIHTHVAWK